MDRPTSPSAPVGLGRNVAGTALSGIDVDLSVSRSRGRKQIHILIKEDDYRQLRYAMGLLGYTTMAEVFREKMRRTILRARSLNDTENDAE